jgi:acetyl-CoA carboxylase biotin carboxyl carrier protein
MQLELMVEMREDSIVLRSPGVGLFTEARREGDLLTGGARAGVLLVLGRAFSLMVPDSVQGRVAAPPPVLVRRPVGWGDPLYELRPIAATTATADAAAEASSGTAAAGVEPSLGLVFRSPQSGRFYLRPGPSEAPFVAVGATIDEGQTLGLIEVMKTFALVRYGATKGLPARAVVMAVLVDDGGDVGAGDPLFALSPTK